MTFVEVFGYVGSVLIALSLMMSNIVPLRWINLVGAAIFSSYGLVIHAWPVAILNGFIVLIDIYHLVLILQYNHIILLVFVIVLFLGKL